MIGFYNENESRDYPFVDNDNPAEVPHEIVVDCGFIFGPTAEFISEEDLVWLAEISRTGTTTTLTFRTNAAELTGEELIFSFDDSDGEYATKFEDFTTVDDPQKWEGFVTIGRPWEVLADPETITLDPNDREVEPTLIHNLRHRVVTKIQCANVLRLQASTPTDCVGEGGSSSLGSSYSFDNLKANSYGAPFDGDVKLKPGYNCRIDIRVRDNSITIGGQVGGGAGETCEDVELYEGDNPPSGSILRSGGPACSELIKTINGAPGPAIELVAGVGFQVREGANPNSIRIVADTTR